MQELEWEDVANMFLHRGSTHSIDINYDFGSHGQLGKKKILAEKVADMSATGVATTAKCRHILPQCHCRGDTILIPTHFLCRDLPTSTKLSSIVPEVHTEKSSVSSDMWVTVGVAKRYLVSDNAKKIRLSHNEK